VKILLCSHPFAPSVGGIETISRILAEEFTKAGEEVTVVTASPDPSNSLTFPYRVVRQPSRQLLRELGKQSDLIFQSNISTQTMLPLLTVGKPIVVVTHTWIARNDGSLAWQDRLKRFLLRFAKNIAISKAIGDSLPVSSTVIWNPFEAELFTPLRGTPKTKDIVFLGRLVSDKGCDLAIQALALLKAEGLTPSLTVIGDGSERKALETMVETFGLGDQIRFLGNLGHDRAAELAKHRIMVVPSRWVEPFGVVALEGIATGCALVASNKGGLPDAVGPCGLLFPNNDVAALAAALKQVLTDEATRSRLTDAGLEHIQNFLPGNVAKKYLEFFRRYA